jgi:hypothetical protein
MTVNRKSSPTRFKPNGFYERLIAMRRTDPKTFDSLSQPTHWVLLEYEKQKRAAAEVEATHNEAEANLPPAA